MAIVTRDYHQKVIVHGKHGKLEIYSDGTVKHNFRFGFNLPFNENPTPATNTVTFYNMSKKHRDFFHKKGKIEVYANWGKADKLLSEGFITKKDMNQTDGVTDTFVITFKEGTDYSNIAAQKMKIKKKEHVHKSKAVKRKNKKGKMVTKHIKTRVTKTKMVNKTYRKGRTLKQVIKGVASQAGIKIAKIQLVKNSKLKKSFTATGKPLTLIEQLVQKAGSKITYKQGKFEIVNPKAKKRSWIVIDDKDLITPPTYNEADDGSNGTWEITTPLLVDAKINDGIKMRSRYLKGKYYIKAGVHSNDGDNPQTQCSLAAM